MIPPPELVADSVPVAILKDPDCALFSDTDASARLEEAFTRRFERTLSGK
jgi:hypothetical protein